MQNRRLSGPDSFEQRMVDILNAGALNLALAVGQRTGLFDILAGFQSYVPAAKIAASAGLNERYVREWLGSMSTGGIVEVQNDAGGIERYRLPADHVPFLTRRGGEQNLAAYAKEIPLLTCCALEQLLGAMQSGNGIPSSSYPAFQEYMSELADARHRRILLSSFLPAVDNGALVARLESGARVCDIGCGEGVALLLMAEAFPHSSFVGIDIDWEALAVARKGAIRLGLKNIEFVLRDALEAGHDHGWREGFDYITAFDAIHEQQEPRQVLQGIRQLLKADGLFSMVDIAAHSTHSGNLDHPLGPFLYTVSLLHCLPVGLYDGGAGLGMMWGREQACGILEEAGFTAVTVEEIPGDPFNLHFFCRK
jgi:SAM-dependent methyltransferase